MYMYIYTYMVRMPHLMMTVSSAKHVSERRCTIRLTVGMYLCT